MRMGDVATGSAFNPRTVPRRDTRLTHTQALNILRCVKTMHPTQTPVFLATDNAALKKSVAQKSFDGLTGVSQSINASIYADIFTQGCTACIVNPVFEHVSPNDSVHDIFLEMLLLAESSCFYYLPSNFASVVKARGRAEHWERR